MSSLEKMLAELSEVLLALDADADIDDAARLELEARRDRLRAELRLIDIDEQRPTAELMEERSRLDARLQTARKERVKKVPGKYLGASQTVGGGIVPTEINRMIDEGNRFDELLERFDHLTAILDSRGAL